LVRSIKLRKIRSKEKEFSRGGAFPLCDKSLETRGGREGEGTTTRASPFLSSEREKAKFRKSPTGRGGGGTKNFAGTRTTGSLVFVFWG